MAIDLNTAQNEMSLAEQAMKAYQNPELPNQIRQNVQQQWTPFLERTTGETNRMMSEYLPRYQQIPYEGMAGGTTAADLNPQQKMQLMSQELGGMAGRLNQQTALSDYFGGKADTMAERALQAMQYGYGTAQDAYGRAFDRYRSAFEADQAEKQRQLQERLARASRAAASAAAMRYPSPSFGGNPIQSMLEQAKGQGESALYKALRQVEAQYGGWDQMNAQQQQLLSPYWGEWQAQKYGEPARSQTWEQLNFTGPVR